MNANHFSSFDDSDFIGSGYTKEEVITMASENELAIGRKATRRRYPWRYGDKEKILPGAKEKKKKTIESLRDYRRMSKSERLAYYVEYAKSHDSIEEAFART